MSVNRKIESNFTDLCPLVILFEFDGPLIFTCYSKEKELLLAYQIYESPNTTGYLLSHFSEELKNKLVNCEITLRDILESPGAVFATVKVDNDWNVKSIRRVSIKDIPSSRLPSHGVMLYPSDRTAAT